MWFDNILEVTSRLHLDRGEAKVEDYYFPIG
jgi:hypothetical protein